MQELKREDMEVLVREILESQARDLLTEVVERFWRENEARAKELSLIERVVRVEEELKALREIESARFEAMEKRFEALQREMNARFEAMEKRFESLQREMNHRFEALQREMNARFEAIEKRLNFMQWFMGVGFSVIVVIMTLINFFK